MSSEAGRALLRVKGVRGTDAELEKASEAFGNHALAINLLANYLYGILGHGIEMPTGFRISTSQMSKAAIRAG